MQVFKFSWKEKCSAGEKADYCLDLGLKEKTGFKAINFPVARSMISSVYTTRSREGAPSCSHPVDVAAAE